MTWVVGVDIGGTFTDFFAFETETNDHFLHKTLSTPDNLARGVVDGIRAMFQERNIDLHRIGRVEHGTTVATNALLQRQGGRVALITTHGFRDLLEIGRQVRPHNYSLQIDQPTPLVPRERRIELPERIMSDGTVRRAPTVREIAEAIGNAVSDGVDACAVCFLFSYLNPTHEREVARLLRELAPAVHVSLSSEVHPEFREYERLSTTVLNAYLQPVMNDYLSGFQSAVSETIRGVTIGINQSSGGLMSIDRARRFPIRTALSGPAAGTAGAIHVARRANKPNVITFDMGGTSTDVCLVQNYSVDISLNRSIAEFPVRLPVVDIHTIGAGGGSIARFDTDGLLKVGPQSAGSSPGPACYGLGGVLPTVTDANLVLGRLSPSGLLGGRMPLSVEASRKALSPLADSLGYSVERIAGGVIDIVVSSMVRAVRVISVERGHDPRDFSLMAIGGAGPMHAGAVARQLEIREVIIPPAPGILCAQGLVVSDLREEMLQTARMRLDDESLILLQEKFETLVKQAQDWFEMERIPAGDRLFSPKLDLRYVGQNYEITYELPEQSAAKALELPSPAQIRGSFLRLHELNYGFHNPDDPVEIVNFRMALRGKLKNRDERRGFASRRSGQLVARGVRPVVFDKGTVIATPIYERSELRPGDQLVGAAVIDQLDSTTLLHPGDVLVVDDMLNLIISLR